MTRSIFSKHHVARPVKFVQSLRVRREAARTRADERRRERVECASRGSFTEIVNANDERTVALWLAFLVVVIFSEIAVFYARNHLLALSIACVTAGSFAVMPDAVGKAGVVWVIRASSFAVYRAMAYLDTWRMTSRGPRRSGTDGLQNEDIGRRAQKQVRRLRTHTSWSWLVHGIWCLSVVALLGSFTVSIAWHMATGGYALSWMALCAVWSVIVFALFSSLRAILAIRLAIGTWIVATDENHIDRELKIKEARPENRLIALGILLLMVGACLALAGCQLHFPAQS